MCHVLSVSSPVTCLCGQSNFHLCVNRHFAWWETNSRRMSWRSRLKGNATCLTSLLFILHFIIYICVLDSFTFPEGSKPFYLFTGAVFFLASLSTYVILIRRVQFLVNFQPLGNNLSSAWTRNYMAECRLLYNNICSDGVSSCCFPSWAI